MISTHKAALVADKTGVTCPEGSVSDSNIFLIDSIFNINDTKTYYSKLNWVIFKHNTSTQAPSLIAESAGLSSMLLTGALNRDSRHYFHSSRTFLYVHIIYLRGK